MGGHSFGLEFSYPRAYEPTVSTAAKSFSIPKELIWSIMRAESAYRKDALSPVGAMGLMQLMPFTATQVSVRLLGDGAVDAKTIRQPEVNIRLGSRYLQRLMTQFQGKIPLAVAAYNAGPHRVHGWLNTFGRLDMDEFVEHIPFLETRNYVKRVLQNYEMYSRLYTAKSQAELPRLSKPVGVKLDDTIPTRENWD